MNEMDALVRRMEEHVRDDIEGEKYPDLTRLFRTIGSYLEHARTIGYAEGYRAGLDQDDYCAGYRDGVRGDEPVFEDWNDDS